MATEEWKSTDAELCCEKDLRRPILFSHVRSMYDSVFIDYTLKELDYL